MAIKKKTWQALMTDLLNNAVTTALGKADSVVADIALLQTTKWGNSNLSAFWSELKTVLCLDSLNESMWKDLLIYTSTFKEYDRRFLLLLSQKLLEYLNFYLKILTDSGVQRALVYAKSYENDGNSASVNRGTESVTPQNPNLYNADEETADTMFDQAIADYASSIDKNKASTSSHSEGESTTNVTGTTWDEQRKNLQMVYNNELCNYLASLPERIYSYYSLDTVPALELTKLFLNHIKESVDLFNTYE